MELFVEIIFLYGLLPVFAISEGGDKDQSLKSNQAFEAKVKAISILDDDATSMSAKHSTYRRLILFDVRPRVLPAQRWIRMFLGVIVIVKFMLL
mmetsp:Transcript_2947/g.3368  ORF Transcript_2947/g.3368 Transcript_2947/m.3368 type:complete len:94 (-) Transcript_2947:663-944(-)